MPTPNKVSAFFSVLLAARHHNGVAASAHRGTLALRLGCYNERVGLCIDDRVLYEAGRAHTRYSSRYRAVDTYVCVCACMCV